jgi:hypothetical protein
LVGGEDRGPFWDDHFLVELGRPLIHVVSTLAILEL